MADIKYKNNNFNFAYRVSSIIYKIDIFYINSNPKNQNVTK